MSSDQGFPHLIYQKGKDHFQWGFAHGEEFKSGIRELYEIRYEMMLQKNPALKPYISELAQLQWDVSQKFSPHLAKEMQGIAEASNLSIEAIIILNNYTDFRDITLADEGCSTIAFGNPKHIIAGQTWDMHSSAKNYVCAISVPLEEDEQAIVFSLVGCVGMMGMTTHKTFVGVNNINTTKAKAGLVWPLLVRDLIEKKSFNDIEKRLVDAPVTSGHNYLIADQGQAAHWEVTPELSRQVSKCDINSTEAIYHTNHCLDKEVQQYELALATSSTSQIRYDILNQYKNELNSLDDLAKLLKSHEGFPKSICSHYESGSQDPSLTCGGGIIDLKSGETTLWRGCETHDANYREYRWQLKDGQFKLCGP